MNAKDRNLLLVEDNALLALAESRQLAKEGYRVSIAGSGEEALEAVLADPTIDLILMDIDLGSGMDGTEAAREILRHRDLPVVFLSSHTEKDIVERTEEISGYGYVVKNSGITVLDASIKMAFRLFDAHRRLGEKYMELEVANEELRVTVDELKDTRRRVEESRARLARAEAIARIGNWELHLDSGTFTGSEGAELIYGLRGEEWALPVVQKVPLPEYRPMMDRALRALIERGEPYAIDFRIAQVGTGAVLDIHSTAVYDAASRTLFGVIQDVTERAKMEAELRFRSILLDGASDGIQALDDEGNFVYLNEAVCRSTGWTREELLGTSVGRLNPAEEAGLIGERLATIHRAGALSFRTTHVRRDGTRFPVEVYARSFETGGRRLVLAVDRDITERVRDELSLHRLVEEKELLMRELSHRVKNSLALVASLLELSLEGLGEGAGREILQDALARVGAISDIHESLSSSESLAVVDFAAYVESLARKVFSTFAPEDGRIRLDLGLEPVRLDARRALPLGLLLNELLTNALKYAYPEPARGEVRVRLAASGGRIGLGVEDDGPGLPPGLRLGEAKSLGLTLVTTLASQLGAAVAVDGSPGARIRVEIAE